MPLAPIHNAATANSASDSYSVIAEHTDICFKLQGSITVTGADVQMQTAPVLKAVRVDATLTGTGRAHRFRTTIRLANF